MRLLLLTVFLLSVVVPDARCWDDAELEIFDLIEEANTNFYEYMEVDSKASSSEIRKAYRKLSLILHPDKNSAPDADIKFRWLASMYEVLKDKEKREIYDRVLVEGLPDWRMPVFYYRRMRKMGLAEGVTYILGIVTLIQYCVNWAAYWERKFTLSEQVDIQAKKITKKAKKGHIQNSEELTASLKETEQQILGEKPTCFDTLPFQLYRGCKALVFFLPTVPSLAYGAYKKAKEEKETEERLIREEEEERKRKEEEKKERKEQRAKRKKINRYEDRTGEANSSSEETAALPPDVDAFKQPANALQVWTDQDLAKLTKLMKKFPQGTPERWEKIADQLERLTWEVTKMAKKVKDVAYQIPISKGSQGMTGLEDKKLISDNVMEHNGEDDDDEEDSEEDSEDSDDDNYGGYTVATKEDYVPVEVKTKKKTKGGKTGNAEPENQSETTPDSSSDTWSQAQQKTLELALSQFPKGTTDRWDRIASKVPDKTKEQCMVRFKHLAEMVKKKKEQMDCEPKEQRESS